MTGSDSNIAIFRLRLLWQRLSQRQMRTSAIIWKIWCFIFAWVQMISLLVSWETLICVASQHRTIVTWTPFNYYLICWAWNCCYPFAAHIDSVAKMRLSFQKAGFLGANLTVTMAALRQMLVTLAISSLWAINKQTHAQSTESYLVLHITRKYDLMVNDSIR